MISSYLLYNIHQKVVGITKTENNHESIMTKIINDGNNEATSTFSLSTLDEIVSTKTKFRDIVFCAPPSGFEDYPKAIQYAIDNIWEGLDGGGKFVFTSSGGM